jgi:hypothetical protein
LKPVLQYCENTTVRQSTTEPWTLEGTLVEQADVDAIAAFPLSLGTWHLFRLRLAIFYDAPLSVQSLIVDEGEPYTPARRGLVHDTEWAFLTAVWRIRSGILDDHLRASLKLLDGYRACMYPTLTLLILQASISS